MRDHTNQKRQGKTGRRQVGKPDLHSQVGKPNLGDTSLISAWSARPERVAEGFSACHQARRTCRTGYAAFLSLLRNFFQERRLGLEQFLQTADFQGVGFLKDNPDSKIDCDRN